MKSTERSSRTADLGVSIERIQIEGASPAFRDTAALRRAFDEAVSRTLEGIPMDRRQGRKLGTIKVRMPREGGIRQIAEAVARSIARSIEGS